MTATHELLGEIVTWDMSTFEVPHAKVQKSLEDAGLDPGVSKDLSYRTAFTRACKHLREQRTIDRLENKDGKVSFQFTQKSLEGGRFEFDYECVVEVDTETGEVTCPESPDLAKQAEELLAYAMGTRNARDVTLLVQNLFKAHADLYPINPRKGVAYFVPEAHREFSAKVEAFLAAVGGRLLRFPVPKGTEEGNRSVQAAVSEGLQTLIDELNSAVEEWDDTTRDSTKEKVFEKWELLSYKVEAYSTYLEGRQSALLDALQKSKEAMKSKMLEAVA